jgi:hypothetical protein
MSLKSQKIKRSLRDFWLALMLELFELSRFFIGKRVPAAGTWIIQKPKRCAPKN